VSVCVRLHGGATQSLLGREAVLQLMECTRSLPRRCPRDEGLRDFLHAWRAWIRKGATLDERIGCVVGFVCWIALGAGWAAVEVACGAI